MQSKPSGNNKKKEEVIMKILLDFSIELESGDMEGSLMPGKRLTRC